MNDDLLYIIPAGLFWLTALAWLLRGMGRLRAAAAWVSAWVSLWLAGIVVAAGPGGAGTAVSSVFGTLFAGLLLAGSFRFGDRPVPRLLPPIIAGAALAVGFTEWMLPAWGGLASSGTDAAFVALAAAHLIRHHTLDRELGPAERAIGPLFLAIVVLELLDYRHHGGAAPNDTLGWWAAVGTTTGFLMVVVVGERARAKEAKQAAALEAESTILQSMTASVPVGILLTDPAGAIQRVNQRMCEHMGMTHSPGYWTGRPAMEMMERVLGLLMERDSRLAAEGAPVFEGDRRLSLAGQPFRFKDGRVVLLSADSVHGSNGRHLGRVWVSRDVTDEQRIAERIHHAERMETVGTLAGGLAHDFNNQLTAILGNAALLRDSEALDSRERNLLGDLESAANHCADLIRRLLTFARREPADPRNIDAREVVERVDSLIRPLLPPDVSLAARVAEGVGLVFADEIQLQRVLTNLLFNARDAVGERGTIELAVEPTDGGVAITISDDGAGMDEATRRRIFDPFFTTKPIGAGTGLGLAVVYGIVEAHGARVEVESQPARGTRFRVLWPGPEFATDAAPPPATVLQGLPQGARVLLAEDEPTVRRLVTGCLERVGLRVDAVSNGDAAVAEFEKRPDDFAAVIFDYAMPGSNGLEAIARIRQLRAGFPALVMSGHPSRTGSDHGWPADVPLILKPFSPERLAQRLAEAMADAQRG